MIEILKNCGYKEVIENRFYIKEGDLYIITVSIYDEITVTINTTHKNDNTSRWIKVPKYSFTSSILKLVEENAEYEIKEKIKRGF